MQPVMIGFVSWPKRKGINMKDYWIARYIANNKPDKYHTISAYSVNEASRIAETWRQKEYMLRSVTKKD